MSFRVDHAATVGGGGGRRTGREEQSGEAVAQGSFFKPALLGAAVMLEGGR